MPDFRDDALLEAESNEASAMGFSGKMSIHPAQLEAIHRAFTPSPDAVASARALLAAYAEHEKATGGSGAFAWEGEMVDAPHLARARALLARAALHEG